MMMTTMNELLCLNCGCLSDQTDKRCGACGSDYFILVPMTYTNAATLPDLRVDRGKRV